MRRTFDDYWLEMEHARSSGNATNAVLNQIADTLIARLRASGWLYTAGNGGSAGDAMDFASEISSRFTAEKPPRKKLRAIYLGADIVRVTAVMNDFGGEWIFAHALEAYSADAHDVLAVFSTSGKSPNILRALEYAKQHGLYRLGFAGQYNSPMEQLCDACLVAPCPNPEQPRADQPQNIHRPLFHYLTECIDEAFRGRE